MTLTPSKLLQQTARASRAVIAMSEGSDPRIVAGSLAACRAGLADIILIGSHDEVAKAVSAAGGDGQSGLSIEDPATSPRIAAFVERYRDLRGHKETLTPETAARAVSDPLIYAALLVREGHATGTVGGAVAATPDVVRAAITMIGKAPEAPLVSSFFLMYPPENAGDDARAMIYSDSGLVPDPDSAQLAAIAQQAAGSFRALMQDTPRVALLSFSTKGSARHAKVSKVTEATALVHAEAPDLAADGELQFDAAFVPAVGRSKATGSDVAGRANVMIFPDLDAGNIGYKISQRLGGYTAIGPVLQGLAKPANDLSRGCSAEDVTEIIAVTVLQAGDA